MKRALLIFLAGIGSLALMLVFLWVLFSRFFSSPEGSDFNLEKEVAAPDGEHIAAHFVGMGGGAVGWCNEVVTVRPSSTAVNAASELERDFKVFSASCGSDVRIRWSDSAELVVTFSSTRRTLATSAFFRPENSDGRVRVRFKIDASQETP
jgi:hypothetical protein